MSQCEATNEDGTPCTYSARPGKRLCGTHLRKQRRHRLIRLSLVGSFLLGLLGFAANVTGILNYFGVNVIKSPTQPADKTQLTNVVSIPLPQSPTVTPKSIVATSSISTDSLISEVNLTNDVFSFSLNPDGSILATGEVSSVRLWSVTDWRLLKTLPVGGHMYSNVHDISFSPDGSLLASTSEGGGLHLWKLSNLSNINSLQVDKIKGAEKKYPIILSLDFDPRGEYIAYSEFHLASSNEAVKVVKASDENFLEVLNQKCCVGDLEYSPDGSILAASDGYEINLLRKSTWNLFSTSNWAKFLTINQEDWLEDMAFSPDGQTLASIGQTGQVKIWRASNGEMITTLESHIAKGIFVEFSPNGLILLTGAEDSTINLWRTADWSLLNSLQYSNDKVVDGKFFPDGDRFLTISSGGILSVWRTN